jgi:hypothetical protein
MSGIQSEAEQYVLRPRLIEKQLIEFGFWLTRHGIHPEHLTDVLKNSV